MLPRAAAACARLLKLCPKTGRVWHKPSASNHFRFERQASLEDLINRQGQQPKHVCSQGFILYNIYTASEPPGLPKAVHNITPMFLSPKAWSVFLGRRGQRRGGAKGARPSPSRTNGSGPLFAVV